MKAIKTSTLIVLFFLFTSCEKIVMHPKPKTDNVSILNEYVKICNEKFGLIRVKGINIEELADSIRPYINDNLTQEEFFNYLGIITHRLKEGHTMLEVPGTDLKANYLYFSGYPNADGYIKVLHYYGQDINPTTKYIGTAEYESLRVQYGRLPQDNDIGFINIMSFMIDLPDQDIEKMMKDLADTKGIIVDVRTNFGGYIAQASKLASYFTKKEIDFATNYIKNGPGQDDFAGSKLKLSPSGSKYTYTKPVMLLYNRPTFSSGTLFSIMMYSMENVTTIGQIFGGGTGEIIYGYLANGWKYSLSTSNLVDMYGRPTDNGIEPDIPMIVNPDDTQNDAVIDRAILELQK